jgi:hypothetical protein
MGRKLRSRERVYGRVRMPANGQILSAKSG